MNPHSFLHLCKTEQAPTGDEDFRMGLFSMCFAGGSFLLIGAWECIYFCSSQFETAPFHSSHPIPINNAAPPTTSAASMKRSRRRKPFSSITVAAVFFLSLLFMLDSSISSIDASRRRDRVGVALQLPTIVTSSLFLLFSASSFLAGFTALLPVPPSILSLVALFAFGQEFLLFYLQRKDPNGLENWYFDLLLLPIFVCFFSTLVELGSPRSPFPRLCRGAGLILQGTWLVQMGFSFFTDFITQGCDLLEKSRGNYTIKCRKHGDVHHSRAIATLLFNCHLAFLVIVVAGLFSLAGTNHSSGVKYSNYRPLGEELRFVDGSSRFTLDSGDEGDENRAAEENGPKHNPNPVQLVSGTNGFVAH